MFQITKEIGFDYGHRVPLHQSKCFHPHGHRAKVVAHCDAQDVIQNGEQTGMVLDFSFLKAILTQVHDILDHKMILSIYDEKMMNAFFPDISIGSLLNALNTKNFIKVVSPSEFNIVFIKETPTAENLAKLIFQEIDCDVKVKSNHNAILTKIEFWETPTSCAFYSK